MVLATKRHTDQQSRAEDPDTSPYATAPDYYYNFLLGYTRYTGGGDS
jgi:hypothetical protein